MQVTLSRGPGGVYYELTAEDGRSQIFQTDWDYPGLASNFGFVPTDCVATDIGTAREFLDEHDGATCEDSGYFDAVAHTRARPK
jgi:hypothetical protein